MKKGIHPETKKVEITCSCWAKFNVYSTIKEEKSRIEICSNCHPFYTWEQRILKTGAVDKFYARMNKTKSMTKKK